MNGLLYNLEHFDMKKSRIAGIDIGTNTILMMVADKFETGQIMIIEDQHSIARLGEGVAHNKFINDKALDRAIAILKQYKLLLDVLNVDEIRAVATSAFRDATNASEITNIFESILSAKVKIISGEEEAYYSFIGAINDDAKSIVVDIGGGSTEIIYGENGKVISTKSIDIGAVRITEKFFTGQPPSGSEISSAGKYMTDLLNHSIKIDSYQKCYGVGGTFTTIAAIFLKIYDFERDKITNLTLKKEDFDIVFNILKIADIEKIVNDYKVHPLRADVLTAGNLIAIKTIEHLKVNQCIISPNGLRYGLIKATNL